MSAMLRNWLPLGSCLTLLAAPVLANDPSPLLLSRLPARIASAPATTATPASPIPTRPYVSVPAAPAISGPYYGTPGGYEGRIGSPYHFFDPYGGEFVVTGDPYYDHFGPGYHRHSLYGHYRFPYYNYRAPWYYPGRAVYNRDTNFAW